MDSGAKPPAKLTTVRFNVRLLPEVVVLPLYPLLPSTCIFTFFVPLKLEASVTARFHIVGAAQVAHAAGCRVDRALGVAQGAGTPHTYRTQTKTA